MLPQTFSVLVTVVGKGAERSSVPFALTIVTFRAMFLKVCHVWEKAVLVIIFCSSFLPWKESTVTLLCVLLMHVVPPNCFTSKFCLSNNTGILFFPSSLNFGEHAFCLKCLVNGTLGSTLWLKSKLINNQNQVVFAIAERTLLKKVSFVVIPNVPLFLFIYHVSRLKAFQKLGTAPIAETYQSSSNQGKPK